MSNVLEESLEYVPFLDHHYHSPDSTTSYLHNLERTHGIKDMKQRDMEVKNHPETDTEVLCVYGGMELGVEC